MDSITERSIDYAWVQHNDIIVCTIDVLRVYTQGIKAWLLRSKACCLDTSNEQDEIFPEWKSGKSWDLQQPKHMFMVAGNAT